MTSKDPHTQAVIQEYDRLAANGPYGTLAPNNRGGHKSRYVSEVFDAALLDKLAGRRVQAILDYGCGTGIFTRKCATLATDAIGMDISAGMLEQAALVCAGLDNVILKKTDGKSIPLSENCVDVVVAREALCHVQDEDLPLILSEIYRVLRPGGRFLWLEQSSNSPAWRHHPSAPTLLKRSPTEMRLALRKAGLEILDARVVRTPRFPWIYPVWFGLVPESLVPVLARWEMRLHTRRDSPLLALRWWNVLFECKKPAHE